MRVTPSYHNVCFVALDIFQTETAKAYKLARHKLLRDRSCLTSDSVKYVHEWKSSFSRTYSQWLILCDTVHIRKHFKDELHINDKLTKKQAFTVC